MAKPRDARWRAVVWYRTETGLVDVEHWLDEVGDLHDLVEAGPHWDTIEKIEIYRVNHIDSLELTIEEAEQI